MHNELNLYNTINELKRIESKREIRSIILSVLSSLDKLYKTQNDLLDEKQRTI